MKPLALLSSATLLCTAFGCQDRGPPVDLRPAVPVELDAYVDRDRITVGERATFRVVLDFATGLDVAIERPDDEMESLPIIERGTEDSRPIPGRTRRVQWYVLQPTRAEVLKLPRFRARLRNDDGVQEAFETETVYLRVERAANADSSEEIRDVWAPEPVSRLPWPWIIATTLAVLGLTAWLWRRRRPGASPAPPSPEERVRESLNRLATLDVSTRDGARVFCFELTETLKSYLEALCTLNASDLTTQEISHAIDSTWLPRELRVDLVQVLRAADRVKFAGDPADVDELRRLHQLAVRFVDRAHRDPDLPHEEQAS